MSSKLGAPTSEQALARYQEAYRNSSVEEVIASIDFEAEALQQLAREHGGTELMRDEIDAVARAREEELRALLADRGFNGGLDVAASEVVTKFQNSLTHHRFILREETMSQGSLSVNTYAMDFHKTEKGWFYVRG
ncbi:MAG: hypothetical protein JWQ07_1413 [Ramlibacter sp.]|nr:hypothetical protein [Ramlibacter sp.]